MATASALMEKVPVKEWTEEEKEVSGDAEGDCGLHTKRRRRPRLSNDAAATAVDGAADEEASGREDSVSFSLEEDQGTKFCSSDGTNLNSTEPESFDTGKKLENGNSEFTDVLDDLQSVPKEGEKQDYNHIKMGNGPNSHMDSVVNVEDEVVPATETEPQSHGHSEAEKTFKLDVSELDLEKVLEEQETHDLFCPNCHSCITKRVILRKRKRRVQDFQYEERPEKLHIRPNIVATSTEIVETSHDSEPDVFRCLSCFSFFIPTENGFNIFRIFRKREESVDVQVPNIQSSGQSSSKDGSRLSSIFKSESSRNKENEAVPIPGAVLPVQSPITSNIGYSGQKYPTSLVLSASETQNYAENAKSKNDGAAQLQPHLEISFGGDHNLEENHGITALPIPVPNEVEESYASNGKLHPVAATQFPIVLDVSSGGDQLQNESKNALALPVSEAANAGENYSTVLKISSDDGDIMPVIINKPPISGGIGQNNHDFDGIIPPATVFLPHDDDVIKPIVIVEPSSQGTSQKDLSISISAAQPTVFLPVGDVQISVGNQILVETRRENEWEVLKSIVYGGLIESITSLGVVSSAAGAKTSTLNIVALGLANLIGGFFVMLHDLSELKSSAAATQNDERSGRYWKLLGRKSNFGLHATVAIMSYLFFGLLPPLIYGFSFRESDLKEDKTIAVAFSSLLCIALLSIGKAHVSEPKSYIKTFLYYLGLGFSASGISYVAGVLLHRFLLQLGLFEHDAPLPLPLPPPSIDLFGMSSGLSSWAAE
ncbi:membrane protein of ER body-like protein isoform X2 [Dendrobium catenatum]|uniref:membrane protein of ER body-like protein isoform X2 n=1 Tax=Dendrobium catenatum TaxID=906689 RepID=UPI0010A0571D|nr:membrane protein of ER body-like protein isoform X2 [Dendrobium catenatum]